MMGRHFAAVAARWGELVNPVGRPEIVAVCNRSEEPLRWFRERLPEGTRYANDYRAVLEDRDVEAVYIAVPHAMHEEVAVAAIEAGKHVLIEKPAGIDRNAAEAILAASRRHPSVFVRCASQFPFFPAAQRIARLIEGGAFGTIVEAQTGLLHSSDLDQNKPINWKRTVAANGEYGVLGDLGMHACHLPLRAGWRPRNVRAVMSNVFTERRNAQGRTVPCDTWDHATLLIDAEDAARGGQRFPWTLRTSRIAAGSRNAWYVEILGTRGGARYSTASPNRFELLEYQGGAEQSWRTIEAGYETAFPTITGPIFEFGFNDALPQMWAAYVTELLDAACAPATARCLTLNEAVAAHALFDAALASQRHGTVIDVDYRGKSTTNSR